MNLSQIGAPGVPGAPGAGPVPPGMAPQAVNRRMNAIKTNHPKDMMGPNMGKDVWFIDTVG